MSPSMFGVNCQVIKGNQEKVEDNLHSMNEHIIVNIIEHREYMMRKDCLHILRSRLYDTLSLN